MTHEEWQELLDLYVEDTLPGALRLRAETYLSDNPDAARDVKTLRAALTRLALAPAERPDPWFVERALDGALHEHAAATSAALLTIEPTVNQGEHDHGRQNRRA